MVPTIAVDTFELDKGKVLPSVRSAVPKCTVADRGLFMKRVAAITFLVGSIRCLRVAMTSCASGYSWLSHSPIRRYTILG